MKQPSVGIMLCLGLVLSSCRTSRPPSIEICIMDGLGSSQCVEKDGAKKTRLPSEMTNYWSTNEDDMAAFSSWCYSSKIDMTKKIMDKIKATATGVDGTER